MYIHIIPRCIWFVWSLHANINNMFKQHVFQLAAATHFYRLLEATFATSSWDLHGPIEESTSWYIWNSRWWFQFFLKPYLGRWSNLTNIFQMGWNHQPEYHWIFDTSDPICWFLPVDFTTTTSKRWALAFLRQFRRLRFCLCFCLTTFNHCGLQHGWEQHWKIPRIRPTRIESFVERFFLFRRCFLDFFFIFRILLGGCSKLLWTFLLGSVLCQTSYSRLLGIHVLCQIGQRWRSSSLQLGDIEKGCKPFFIL